MSETSLVKFLREQFDEDETAARNSEPLAWLWNAEDPYLSAHPATAIHIASWSPQRVLAECEAKRRIVAGYADAKHHYEAEHDVDGSQKYSDGGAWAFLDKLEVWEAVLKLLALPYAEHPGYRPEWKPS